jgi:transcriptional regulator with XRE-family HTH domain
VKDLLVLLGRRVHELRSAKNWSQEEFAHVSGLHRTYIGQIERGEKNISFANLLKIAGVLGVTMSELLSGIEDVNWSKQEDVKSSSTATRGPGSSPLFEISRLMKRLQLQRAAMDRTMELLEKCVLAPKPNDTRSGSRNAASRKTRAPSKKASPARSIDRRP